ncbi:hypothetical protein [Prauserella cavernicola]|uniref:Uncharacterized protein n=1 Tax=Prauserella cavernicola TaxID=2800127 RepID=A0A934QW52_9PSEU|nr:hypothetical protein [Prauserella cavernicola]MBK1789367.1 hypothetical protein [Prauserella cavernicola]
MAGVLPEAPFSGSLPVATAGPAVDFAASRGELPIPAPSPAAPEELTDSLAAILDGPDVPDMPDAAEAQGDVDDTDDVDGEPTSRRKKVTLTTCERPARRADDEARVYLAPPPDGLGKFDLGSVPASVTPPRSWRKAAWFASISSGGVVVALLVAGTVLVGQPPSDRQAIEGWPDRHGGVAPLLPHEGYAEDSESFTDDASSLESSDDGDPSSSSSSSADEQNETDTQSGLRSSSSSESATSSESEPGQPSQTTDPQPTTPELRKPPVTPAPTTKAKQRYVTLPPYDADELGAASQSYLDTVTEDSSTAYAMTTGELAAGGEAGLRERYADVAYFEVKHIYIDQNEGYTVNTVEVTHADGSKTEETRKLMFEDDSKIASDGQ